MGTGTLTHGDMGTGALTHERHLASYSARYSISLINNLFAPFHLSGVISASSMMSN